MRGSPRAAARLSGRIGSSGTRTPRSTRPTRWFLQASLGAAVQGAILDRLADRRSGSDGAPGPLDTTGLPRGRTQPPETRIIPTPLQQTVPGWSLFAMFFIAVPLSGSFIRERAEERSGAFTRIPSRAPRSSSASSCPTWRVNVLQFAAMLAIGLFVLPRLGDFRLQLGARPWHLAAVTLAAAFAATGFGALVAAVSRTIEQASALGATAVVVMAVAGGIMVPVFIMPRPMRTIALGSPLYWGHQAYLDVMLRDAPLATLAPKLAVLAGFAAVFLAVASWRTRREV